MEREGAKAQLHLPVLDDKCKGSQNGVKISTNMESLEREGGRTREKEEGRREGNIKLEGSEGEGRKRRRFGMEE